MNHHFHHKLVSITSANHATQYSVSEISFSNCVQYASAGSLKKLHTFCVTFCGVSLNQVENCSNSVLSTASLAPPHIVSADAITFHGIALLETSFFSVALLNKSGVAAFLNDIDDVHNKSLAFTVGV